MEFLRAIARNTGNLVALAIAAAVVFAVAGTFLVAACGGVAPLPPGESCMQCAREWISSLSGWGAVVAAFFTVAMIRRQILHTHLMDVRRQLTAEYYRISEEADILIWVAGAIRRIGHEASKFYTEDPDRRSANWNSIAGAHGLQAIEARLPSLKRASRNNAQAVINEASELRAAMLAGTEDAIVAKAFSLHETCKTIGEAVDAAGIHKQDQAFRIDADLATLTARLKAYDTD